MIRQTPMPDSSEPPLDLLSADALDTLASLYALMATVFRDPRGEECDLLGNESHWEATRCAAAALDANLLRPIITMERRLRKARRHKGDEHLLESLVDAHARLFSHAVRGACPPYEMEYGRRDIVQQSPELADIGGFYAAFGLQLTPGAHERLDHISVECEFMSWLARKELAAGRMDQEESVRITRDARRAFLTDHLGRWGPAFARQLVEADPGGFLGTAGAALAELIAWDAARLGVSLGPLFLELAPTDEEPSDAFNCGLDDAPPAGQRLVTLGVDRDHRTRNHVDATSSD